MLKIYITCIKCGKDIDIINLFSQICFSEPVLEMDVRACFRNLWEANRNDKYICDDCRIEHRRLCDLLKFGWKHVFNGNLQKTFIGFSKNVMLAQEGNYPFFIWNDAVIVTKTGKRFLDNIDDDSSFITVEHLDNMVR